MPVVDDGYNWPPSYYQIFFSYPSERKNLFPTDEKNTDENSNVSIFSYSNAPYVTHVKMCV